MDERKEALLIREAIHELGIDVPIIKVCELGEKQIELYLYGGRVVVYPPAVSPEMAGFEEGGRPSPGKAVRTAAPEKAIVKPGGKPPASPSPKAGVSSIGEVNHPAVRDLEGMDLTGLRSLARRRRIAGAGKLTKKQLIQALREAR